MSKPKTNVEFPLKGDRGSIEIMDTTLRDGEQTSGVSFMPHEKLMIARALLQDVGVDRIEVASARVSEGEMEAVKSIARWASQNGKLDRVEVLGFVDETKSVDWIVECGCQCMNLLCKGSRKHCEGQLHKTLEEHIADIRRTIAYAQKKGVSVNVYLEDWSNGMKDSPDYVFALMEGLADLPIRRFMLPDTLGILNPMEVGEFINKMIVKSEERRVKNNSNKLEAETNSDSSLFTLHSSFSTPTTTTTLPSAMCLQQSWLVAKASIPASTDLASGQVMRHLPACRLSSRTIFTSIHILMKAAWAKCRGSWRAIAASPFRPTNPLLARASSPKWLVFMPMATTKRGFIRMLFCQSASASGKANILRNLEELGLELSPEQTKRVTERIIELGDKKELVTQEDLPFIVSDVLKHGAPEEHVKLLSYVVTTAYGLKPLASVRLEINGETYEESAKGDGQFDAFVRAIRHIYKDRLGRSFPWLTNYTVSIPPGGRTDALVQTVITWNWNDRILRTRGLDADQTEAAIKSTIKMLNLLEEE